MAKLPIVGVVAIAGGGLLAYSAINGKGFSSAVRTVLSGQSPASAQSANQISDYTLLAQETGQTESNIAATLQGPTVNSSDQANQAIVQKVAAQYGWNTGAQWAALNNVIMRESGYNNNAQNPNSSAYGIFQFLDTTWANFGAKTSNPTLQSVYGLEYIKQRYGNPVNAWNHELQYGWY